MFENYKTLVGKQSPPNRFWSLTRSQVADAETRAKLSFPPELRTFYLEIGWGFYAKGTKDSKWNRFLVNRVLPPGEIADLLLDSTNPGRPEEGFPKGMFPFFDIGSNSYLLLNRDSKRPTKVYHVDGKEVVAHSVRDFFSRLFVDASFFNRVQD